MKKFIVLGIIVTALWSTASGQPESLQKIQQQYKTFAGANPQEKLFVHTDKELYLVGEIVWFRLYSDKKMMSSIAYVDIIDAANKSVLEAKVSLKPLEDNGSALIPLSVNTGNYTLRAYTNWMKNDAGNAFFEKNITIVNPFKNPDTATQRKQEGYAIQFFPEGGNMVKGLQSKIAFKITDKYGKGVSCQGKVISESGEQVTNFSTFKFGMGQFSFTPTQNNYKAIVELPNGTNIPVSLPAVYDNGYVMTTQSNGNNFEVSVKSNYTGPQDISLYAQASGELKHAESGVMSDGSLVFTIPKEKTGSGVIQLTVFNAMNRPVCERLVFVRPATATVNLTANSYEFGNRKKVEIDVNTKSKEGSPVAADLSVAVFPLDPLQPEEQTDIATYMLLTSDLKGYIESPEYYLSSQNAETETAIENLLLTHGWRRYNWTSILSKQPKEQSFTTEYDAHLVKVQVTDKTSRQPLAEKEVFLSIPGTKFDFITAITNMNGVASFNVKELYGSAKIVLQVKGLPENSYDIDVISPFNKGGETTVLPFYLPNQDSLLEKYSINMQVQNIFNADSMRMFYAREPKDSMLFYGKAMYAYNLDAYTRFTTMEEVLREYVREINVAARNGKLYLKILDEGRKEFNEEDILVLWDGVPLADPNNIFNFDPLKVKRLEVVPRRFAAGGSFFKGIASFITYNGDMAGYNLPRGTFSIDYEGMQLQREFYSPVYETASQMNSRMPDFRNTLYWTPNLGTASNGTARFHFYTGDRKGKYRVVLQGLDENGSPVVSTITFEVK